MAIQFNWTSCSMYSTIPDNRRVHSCRNQSARHVEQHPLVEKMFYPVWSSRREHGFVNQDSGEEEEKEEVADEESSVMEKGDHVGLSSQPHNPWKNSALVHFIGVSSFLCFIIITAFLRIYIIAHLRRSLKKQLTRTTYLFCGWGVDCWGPLGPYMEPNRTGIRPMLKVGFRTADVKKKSCRMDIMNYSNYWLNSHFSPKFSPRANLMFLDIWSNFSFDDCKHKGSRCRKVFSQGLITF